MATILRPSRESYDDAERRLLGWLRQRYAEDRLTLDEFEAKVAAVLDPSTGVVERDRMYFEYR